MRYFNATDSRRHEDIETLHDDPECHHLDEAASVRGVDYVPDGASVCGTCGEPEGDEDDENE